VPQPNGENEADLIAGSNEIKIAGQRFPWRGSQRRLYDPAGKRVRG
jgi:hypothetical protein